MPTPGRRLATGPGAHYQDGGVVGEQLIEKRIKQPGKIIRGRRGRNSIHHLAQLEVPL
jgi:hypothetical protein